MYCRQSVSKLAFILFLACLLPLSQACSGGGGSGSFTPPDETLPQEEAFELSGHADETAEAFNHWDGEAPPEVPVECAKCHNTSGFLDFLGILDPNVRVVDNPVAIDPAANNALTCDTCHNDQTFLWDTVVFPSGEQVNFPTLTRYVFCMECHQGRESKVSVDQAIADAAPPDDDTVDPDLEFLNIHYFAAAATRYGTEVKGGYEYDGMAYDGYFPHVQRFEGCTDCHSTHSLEIRADECGECHEGVADEGEIVDIRMPGSTNDYNGNGNVTEGITFEIAGLRDTLYDAMQAYANANAPATQPIIYDGAEYPYFFIDTNNNGDVDPGENTFSNGYNTWTAKLVKAAYNLQYSLKDPGCSAHNAKYIIALLYDSIVDLDSVDTSALVRNDSGHFDPTSEAFRHWDEDGEVDAACTRCHAPPAGFDYYIQNLAPSPVPLPVSYGLTCETCHTGDDFAGEAPRKYVATVVFPGGATSISNNPDNPDDSFLCMSCHQGRESKATIDAAIAGGSLSFKNVHYLGAGATLYGTVAKVGYEYDGKTYDGKFNHFSQNAARCFFCHEVTGDRHAFLPKLKDSCRDCHEETVGNDIQTIRLNRPVDYDNDGDTTEKLVDEIRTLSDAVYTAMQSYAHNVIGTDIIYDEAAYPYFFIDTNGNGDVDPGENVSANKFTAWDASLMKAAHNFQHSLKEHGAWAHNTDYIAQLLIDSIEDLMGSPMGYNRP